MAFIKGNVVCGKEVFLAHDADVIGNVTLGDDSSVWYNAVVR